MTSKKETKVYVVYSWESTMEEECGCTERVIEEVYLNEEDAIKHVEVLPHCHYTDYLLRESLPEYVQGFLNRKTK